MKPLDRINMLRTKATTYHRYGKMEEFIFDDNFTVVVYNDEDDDYGEYCQIHSSTNRLFPKKLTLDIDTWLLHYQKRS